MRIELTTSYLGHTLQTYVDKDGVERIIGIVLDLSDEQELCDQMEYVQNLLIHIDDFEDEIRDLQRTVDRLEDNW